MNWWWLSFADETFLGVAIVRAANLTEAVLITHLLEISPGGQALGIEWPENEPAPRPHFTNRLLSKEDILDMQGEARTLGEMMGEVNE